MYSPVILLTCTSSNQRYSLLILYVARIDDRKLSSHSQIISLNPNMYQVFLLDKQTWGCALFGFYAVISFSWSDLDSSLFSSDVLVSLLFTSNSGKLRKVFSLIFVVSPLDPIWVNPQPIVQIIIITGRKMTMSILRQRGFLRAFKFSCLCTVYYAIWFYTPY